MELETLASVWLSFSSYYLNEQGDLVYMLKKLDLVEQTRSTHPAWFSPDKYFDTAS